MDRSKALPGEDLGRKLCGSYTTRPPPRRLFVAFPIIKFILRSRFAAAELSSHLSPHSLRHSFITLAIRGGATLAQVQAAARHADPRTTMRYVHCMDDLDNNAVDYVNW